MWERQNFYSEQAKSIKVFLLFAPRLYPLQVSNCSLFQIKQEGVKSYFIDGRDEECSNWLRFINCARNEEEQNLVAFQFKGHIYYRTFKTVYPGNELFVWYGEEYAKDLGISVGHSGMLPNSELATKHPV